MNKEYKPVNISYREHFKLHGYLSLTMIEELLDKVDELEGRVSTAEHDAEESHNEMVYWREQCENMD
jgi:hypothetical protein